MCLYKKTPSILPDHPSTLNPSTILGPLTQGTLGEGFGDFILIVVAMEAVTTGDTALRSCRLVIADFFKIDQKSMKKRIAVSTPLFIICMGLLM
ncbi:hypothetical protein FACS1894218_7200 [Bacilli bacterium]|nr:hypothetical protein FACS1894218_7200 [Bacilli bacterium]